MPHQPRQIGRFAEGRIADHVQIRKTGKTERLSDPVPSGFLHISQKFRRAADLDSGQKRQHARTGILRFRRQAVRPLVRRTKRRMPLGDDVYLA